MERSDCSGSSTSRTQTRPTGLPGAADPEAARRGARRPPELPAEGRGRDGGDHGHGFGGLRPQLHAGRRPRATRSRTSSTSIRASRTSSEHAHRALYTGPCGRRAAPGTARGGTSSGATSRTTSASGGARKTATSGGASGSRPATQREHLRLQRAPDRVLQRHPQRDPLRARRHGHGAGRQERRRQGAQRAQRRHGHPNDGSIWFTDPVTAHHELRGQALQHREPAPFIKEAVYRIHAQSKKVTKVTDEPFKPNGMCFSHDYKKVYIADTARPLQGGEAHHLGYDVDGQTLKNGKVLPT